ncbi:MAG: cytochrome c1 [Gammaproteobacteria bacterium]|jgi:ubiquinol-cytochrome c reductase cytochrome c1 subunit
MKKQILTLLLSVLPTFTFAAGGGVPLDSAPIDISDMGSVKRGAIHFIDYCFSCHSASYMRYNRIARDTGMSDGELRENLIFTTNEKGEPTKVGSLMKIAMTDEYAKEAFGGAVPDLTLTARARGADWLYSYLRSFYVDPYRPTGMNNLVFPDVGMPNVLSSLQGLQNAVYKTETKQDVDVEYVDHLELAQPGSMTAEEFDAFVADLVNFLVYLGEPVQNERRSLGIKVLIFLVVFFVLAYLLKKEYWKDVH